MAVLVLLLCPFVPSGCIPVVVVQELAYRPSPNDPYQLWEAYITDSGLLLLCGSVDNGRESVERVVRYYNLELRLEETLDSLRSDAIQVVQINDHPSLQMIRGYPSDLCQFDEKRATRRPEETGWTEVFMAPWDEGFVKVYPSDLEAGRLPIPPAEPRIVLYQVYDSDPPEYLLMGRFRKEGPERNLLLILGSEHIEAMW
jgi:hypothetical protein